MVKQIKSITVPSFFWENFLNESIPGSAENLDVASAQRTCDQARGIIERTNERIRDISADPTATQPQKKIQIERVAKQAKQNLEKLINDASASLMDKTKSINQEISSAIGNADRIEKSVTMQKLNSMQVDKRSSFIRQLAAAGDFETLSHIVGRSAAFLEIDPAEFEEVKQTYVQGAFPDKAKELATNGKLLNNYKKGILAVVNEFDSFGTELTQKAEKAQKALRE
ncbi:MAG: hypothetical protein WD267_01205 [Balneolales bacterium]